jgi:hypothetical protein
MQHGTPCIDKGAAPGVTNYFKGHGFLKFERLKEILPKSFWSIWDLTQFQLLCPDSRRGQIVFGANLRYVRATTVVKKKRE